MNKNITLINIIILIVVILVVFYVINKCVNIEHFTNDEAVQNIASLYNQSKFAVTDLTSTGTATLNTLNVNGNAQFKNGSFFPYTDGNNYITSPNNILRGGITSVQGNLNVSGATNTNTLAVANGATINGNTTINALTTGYSANIGTDLNVKGNTTLTGPLTVTGGIQHIVLDSTWDSNAFNQKMKPYFNRSMPDGTAKTFIFVAPNRTSGGNVNMRRIEAVKLGTQIVIFGYLDWISGSPWVSASGDDPYRVNI